MAATEQKNSILQKAFPFLKLVGKSKDLAVVVFIIAILAVIIIPLPSWALDFLLTISMALSILIILIALYINKPMDFSTFPTLLLFVTAFRLALNVATTRMILSEGSSGAGHVSKIVEAFGQFVAGGNYVIGVIIFTILVIVNLLVITNGSTRVTEVRARFALDAMPGKQMAIDADLNAGLIDEKEAKSRRELLSQEADFYGAMDGASKFVKGDAIAAIIITIVNIVGGFAIGVFQDGMDMTSAAKTFTILTIGDGIVSQIPALIVATATGIVATRTTRGEEENFANSLVKQLTDKSKTLVIVGFVLFIFALAPSFPAAPLMLVALTFWLAAWLINRDNKDSILTSITNLFAPKKAKAKKDSKGGVTPSGAAGSTGALPQQQAAKKPPKTQEEIKKEEEKAINEVLKVEFLELHLGYNLIRLAAVDQGGDLLERVRGIRKKIARDYGFLMPQIRMTDDPGIGPTTYQFFLKGIEIGSGEVMPDKFLAMNMGMVGKPIDGIPTKEPAFGLDAIWIDANLKEDAIIQGYTVIDPSTVIATHMSELVKEYAEEFITKDEVKKLMDRLEGEYPEAIAEAKKVPTSLIRKVLQNLLHEGVPIKDMLTILETITDVAPMVQNDESIVTEQVRAHLSRVITSTFKSEDGTLKLVNISMDTETHLLNKVKEHNGAILLLNPNEMQKLISAIEQECVRVVQRNISPVIFVVDPKLRKPLYSRIEQFKLDSVAGKGGNGIVVLSNAEIDPNVTFEIVGTLQVDFQN
ncbi:flagellar biosynthesis protein FlhA [Helicobacter saguini]|uniref:Flagellar biosynthesis protein FlhA n=1 Tax=Helicobacter saguini TaxID=1548018 RepID=A0A347VMX7_9HELI|nr:flagellar biosynthesis protein FlhA [Helicobacter saguini]MWV61984.1 flagellar biosynthesis protein FlhA [Helicobacter saguini]MWV67342.1 flagellar biosynthesis protein FlhA [Helicobacter saguini]MWV69693.1 flagellar biosynthesis protein FlhA [Helicobacter saguini]MWV73089.1 flagellar biosynthesis protein FlhA [Helicobacter saguini]TLD95542.1 flagellar biosynthesis protein FlhA [Helicobacter saguini]